MTAPYNIEKGKKIFSERFRHYYEKSGKTQKDLGALLGVEAKTIAAYLAKNPIMPRWDGAFRICNLFKISLDDLFREPYSAPPARSGADSDAVFSAADKKALEDAFENVQDPMEECFEIEQGEGIVRHKIFGTCRIPTAAMEAAVVGARAAFQKELQRQLRKQVDESEKAAVYENEIELCNQALEKEILKEEEARTLREEYDDYCSIVHEDLEEKGERIPFHNYREVLFFVFFIRQDPFQCVERELDALRYRDLKPKAKQELYQRMMDVLGEACAEPDNPFRFSFHEHHSSRPPEFIVDAYLRSIGYSRKALFDHLSSYIDALMLEKEKISEEAEAVRLTFFYQMVSLIYRKRWGGQDVEAVLEYVEETARCTERNHMTMPRMKAK